MVHSVVPLGPHGERRFHGSFQYAEGSQWDGLGHVGHCRHELFYNGVSVDETRQGNARLGIHHWADKFVGRGVLIDAVGLRKARGVAVSPVEGRLHSG
jgi:hypothetical protein